MLQSSSQRCWSSVTSQRHLVLCFNVDRGSPVCSHAKLRLRWLSSSARPDLVRLRKATVFPFGVPTDDTGRALLRDLSLTISDGHCWALVSDSTSPVRRDLVATIRSHNRVEPRTVREYPILEHLPHRARPKGHGPPRPAEVDDIISHVHFKTRLAKTGDGFRDYTARYYAIREEDNVTLRQSLLDSIPYFEPTEESDDERIERLAATLRIRQLLDAPLVTLSNGQNRRVSILRGLLTRPELLILEEPFTGLDVQSRHLLNEVCARMHAERSPRVLLTLRPQDELPDYVTHVALLGQRRGDIMLGTKQGILATEKGRAVLERGARERERIQHSAARRKSARTGQSGGAPVVQLSKLNIAYGSGDAVKPVLRDVDWTVRQGERWVLAGHNGSGKSTLLAVILGDHPKSYTEDVRLFDKPRDKIATITLQENVRHTSPEIFNAFPRSHGPDGLTAREAIATGFHSVFTYRRLSDSEKKQLDDLLESFGHPLLRPSTAPSIEDSFENKLFADLAPGEQSLVLFLRALVKRCPLVVLDEPFAGMDADLVERSRKFLDDKLSTEQAVIFVSHFEEEIPDSIDRRLTLEEGRVKEVQ